MSVDGWREVKFGDVIQFNPCESLKKGKIAKKIAMEQLEPFTRKITNYELSGFIGGSKFRNGDTLLARITPCLENGKTAYVDILSSSEVAFGSTEFIVMRNKENITDDKFIYYLAISPDFRDKAIKSMTGTSGRQRIQQDVLQSYKIILPPLPEQKAIADTLSALDDMIELNNQINKTLEEMAQAIFKSWFVDFEPFKDGEFEESERGPIPKGWRVVELNDISKDIVCGKTPSTKDKENFGNKMPFITIPDMYGNVFITKTERYLSQKGIDTQYKKTLPKFSVCVSCIATPGLVSITSEKSQTNQQINSIICKDNISCFYVYLYLNSIRDTIRTLGSGGSATLNLNKSQFSKIKIIECDDLTMTEFHNLVKPLFLKILDNQIENHILSSIRDALLPKLMSGEIRVPVEEVI